MLLLNTHFTRHNFACRPHSRFSFVGKCNFFVTKKRTTDRRWAQRKGRRKEKALMRRSLDASSTT
jgi:hypothetical protein